MFEAPPRPITQIVFWLDGVIAPVEYDGSNPLTPTAGIMALVRELAQDYSVALVSNGEQPTFADQHDAEIAEQVEWPQVEAGPYADQYAALQAAFAKPGHCLFIDRHPLRGMAALRAGFDCSIFIDTWRLRRDLFLWRILADYDKVRPAV